MDMEEKVTWLYQPVTWRTSHTLGPDDYDWSAMTEAQAAMIKEKFLNWYHADWDYAYPTVAYFCVAIGLATIANVVFRLRSNRSKSSGALARIVGLTRFTVSRQYRLRVGSLGVWYSPPLGAIIGVFLTFLFVVVFILAKRPYRWPIRAMGHSLPIATRSGWIATAMIPFMIACSTKVNYIAAVTGTSHEKLQVYHRWLATIMFIPSMVHGIPFIYMSVNVYDDWNHQWNMEPFMWTGVVALVAHAYLVLTSWGIFRNAQYEIFKKLHFVAAGLMMAALFVHVNFTLDSWDYFWATAAIYGSTWLFRVARTAYNSGSFLIAHVSLLPSGPAAQLLHVRIPVRARMKWRPGQHVFIRFWGLGLPHALSSHPWTIASLPHVKGDERTLEFVLRVHGGITKALARRVEAKASFPLSVWVDGPYGGVPGGLDHYDEVLLLAGGSGSTAIVPLFVDLLERKPKVGQRIKLVVSLRSEADYSWMKDLIEGSVARASDLAVSVHVHITGDDERSAPADADLDVKEDGDSIKATTSFVEGRPVLPAVIREVCENTADRVAIAACGPDGFLFDVRNEVASLQLEVAKGEGIASDIFLHTENYGW